MTILQFRWVRFIIKGTTWNLWLCVSPSFKSWSSFCHPRFWQFTVDHCVVSLYIWNGSTWMRIYSLAVQSRFQSMCQKANKCDRKEAPKQASAESVVNTPPPFPFETPCCVFALFCAVLLSTSDCRKTHPVARTSPVFTILFWLVFVRINSAASDVTPSRLSGGYRPVRSICFTGHFRQCPFLSHYFGRNWISSDAFLSILSAAVFSLGVYHFQRGSGSKTAQL